MHPSSHLVLGCESVIVSGRDKRGILRDWVSRVRKAGMIVQIVGTSGLGRKERQWEDYSRRREGGECE